MSLQALNELYYELNRITIAGVNLAKGDYRINRLIPIFKKSSESAPVFNKVASLTEKLTIEGESNVLLDLLNLVIAMLSTVGKTGMNGQLEVINVNNKEVNTSYSYRKLKPVIDALESTGSGRMAIITSAYQEGIFTDIRTINPLIKALSDSYSEIYEFAMDRLVELGHDVLPMIKANFDSKEAKSCRKVLVIEKIAEDGENEWYKNLLNEETHEDVLIEAIHALKFKEDNLDLVLEYCSHKKKSIRQAAFESLGYFNDIEVTNAFYKAFDNKDRDIIKEGIKNYHSIDLVLYIINKVKETIDLLLKSNKFIEAKTKNITLPYSDKDVSLIFDGLDILSTKNDDNIINLYFYLSHFMGELILLGAPKSSVYKSVGDRLADNLLLVENKELLNNLSKLKDQFDYYYLNYAFVASTYVDDPKTVFNTYSKMIKNDVKNKNAVSIIDLFYYLATNIDYKTSKILLSFFSKTIVNIDKRWLDFFIELDNLPVVKMIIHDDSKKIVDYLISQVNRDIERGYVTWDLMVTLFSIDEKQASKLLIDIIEKLLAKKNHYLKLNFEVIQLLPSKYSKDLEKMGTKYGNSELIEFAKNMR